MRGEGLGSTFIWQKKSIPAPAAHAHARNWRLSLFLKGTLKLTTNPAEILKSQQQRVGERIGLSPEFTVAGFATRLQNYMNQVSTRGNNLKCNLFLILNHKNQLKHVKYS